MPTLDATVLDHLTFSGDDLATLRTLGEHRGRQDLFRARVPEVLEALRTVALVESSESSNRLEGIEAPRDRLELLVLRESEPENRSEQEIAGYRDVLHVLHERGTEIPFTANVILRFHRDLYSYMPQNGGTWKATDDEIVERDEDGNLLRVRFRPTPAVTRRILAAIDRRLGPFAISELEEDCPGVSRDMIRHVLRKEREKGRLRSFGRGRAARWERLPTSE